MSHHGRADDSVETDIMVLMSICYPIPDGASDELQQAISEERQATIDHLKGDCSCGHPVDGIDPKLLVLNRLEAEKLDLDDKIRAITLYSQSISPNPLRLDSIMMAMGVTPGRFSKRIFSRKYGADRRITDIMINSIVNAVSRDKGSKIATSVITKLMGLRESIDRNPKDGSERRLSARERP